MECEIINPSDGCSISGENPETLALACILLGNGQYGLKDMSSGKEICPLMIFGGGEEWYKKQHGRGIKEGLLALNDEIADVLGTFRYFGERGSLNNIGQRAKQIAKALIEKSKDIPKAPQQVFGV